MGAARLGLEPALEDLGDGILVVVGAHLGGRELDLWFRVAHRDRAARPAEHLQIVGHGFRAKSQ